MREKIYVYKRIIPISIVLLYLTFLSLHITCNLVARYNDQSLSSDNAGVVKFGRVWIEESGDGDNAKIIPGVNLIKRMIIKFQPSEVDTYIFAELDLSEEWTSQNDNQYSIISDNKVLMEFAISKGWEFLLSEDGRYVYYQVSKANNQFSEDIIAEDGNIYVNELITNEEILGLENIYINLQASAIQSSGVENPLAVWNSFKKKI